MLLKYPAANGVLASYGQQLAIKASRQVREIIRSPEYAEIAPHTQISEEKASEREWETTAGGGIKAVGVGSALTGSPADFLVLDDLIKDRAEASSALILETAFEWCITVALTRRQPGACVVVPMTRWSEYDPVGRFIDVARKNENADQWYILRLPALAEQGDPLGREVGAALWPESYPKEFLLAMKALNEDLFEALYQQNPRSDAQISFEVDKIKIGDCPFQPENTVWGWDLAVTDNETSDWMVGALVSVARVPMSTEAIQMLTEAGIERPYMCHIHQMVRSQAQFPEQRRVVIQTALQGDYLHAFEYVRMDMGATQLLIEDMQALGHETVKYRPIGDKVSRKAAILVETSRGNVSISPGAWNEWFLEEADRFPNGEHDDSIDAWEIGYACAKGSDFKYEIVGMD
jgi:predicted phage terminase large subunit-like protein